MRFSSGGYGGYRGRSTMTEKLKVIAAVLAVLVVIVIAALFFGQEYIVYTDNGPRLDLPFFRDEDDTPDPGDISIVERPGNSSGQPDKSGEPGEQGPVQQPDDERESWMRALELPVETVLNGTAAGLLEQAGANALILEMKNAEGQLWWKSAESLAKLAGVSAEGEGVNDALKQWNGGEIYTIARVCCFRDNALPYYCNRVALRKETGNWRDEMGMRHLDPTDAEAQAYLAGLCGELAALGFDEIVLEHCSYPVRGQLDRIIGSDGDPLTAIEGPGGFLEQVQQALAPYETVLSVRAELGMINGEQPGGGLTAAGLNTDTQRIWVDQEELGPFPAQLLESYGITGAADRLVELVPALVAEPKFEIQQAQLSVSP